MFYVSCCAKVDVVVRECSVNARLNGHGYFGSTMEFIAFVRFFNIYTPFVEPSYGF